MAAGLTLRDVLCPPAPEPVPEPEPEPPFLEALMGAIRGAVDEWTERAMQQGACSRTASRPTYMLRPKKDPRRAEYPANGLPPTGST